MNLLLARTFVPPSLVNPPSLLNPLALSGVGLVIGVVVVRRVVVRRLVVVRRRLVVRRLPVSTPPDILWSMVAVAFVIIVACVIALIRFGWFTSSSCTPHLLLSVLTVVMIALWGTCRQETILLLEL